MFPKFRIQAHVLVYSLILGGGTMFALVVTSIYGPTDEQKRNALLKKYPDQIKKNEVQRQQMQDFFDEMKLKNNKDQALNNKFDDVLKGGKSNMKRWHELQAVDKSGNNTTGEGKDTSTTSLSPSTQSLDAIRNNKLSDNNNSTK